jgi:hypothetical protein
VRSGARIQPSLTEAWFRLSGERAPAGLCRLASEQPPRLVLERVPHRSDRKRDLPDKADENETAAKPMARAFIRQEDATEADQRSKRDSDLTGSVHVLVPRRFAAA